MTNEQSRRLADRLDRLSMPLAENVIRRAIELHHDEQLDGDSIDLEMVEQIGAELGIRKDIIRKALIDELQTERDHGDTVIDRLLGPDRVSGGIVTRADREALADRIAEWMHLDEGMRPRAKNAGAVRWEKDPGIGTAIRRGMKQSKGTGALRASPKVITRQTEVGSDEHLVEIEADTSHARAESAGVATAVALGAAGVGTAIAVGTGNPLGFLAGFLPGIGVAAFAARAYARARIRAMRDGINRALDGILHPRDDEDARSKRRKGRGRGQRKPSWVHIVEEIVDEIFD